VIVNSAASTGVCFARHSQCSPGFSYLRATSAASRLAEADLPTDAIRAARILHVSGITQAISPSAAKAILAAIDSAWQGNVLVSYDTNPRWKLSPLARARVIIHEAMRRTDIALPGHDDAAQLTGLTDSDAVTEFYLRLGAEIVALTRGKNGALVPTARRHERIDWSPFRAIDATGARDAFDGDSLSEFLASNNDNEPTDSDANSARPLAGKRRVQSIPRTNIAPLQTNMSAPPTALTFKNGETFGSLTSGRRADGPKRPPRPSPSDSVQSTFSMERLHTDEEIENGSRPHGSSVGDGGSGSDPGFLSSRRRGL
jgi:sugar/nucleoside kinase (ribokinase family)